MENLESHGILHFPGLEKSWKSVGLYFLEKAWNFFNEDKLIFVCVFMSKYIPAKCPNFDGTFRF